MNVESIILGSNSIVDLGSIGERMAHLPIGVDYAGDASPPDFVMNHYVPTTLKKKEKVLLNAVERSVHLHGLFTTLR